MVGGADRSYKMETTIMRLLIAAACGFAALIGAPAASAQTRSQGEKFVEAVREQNASDVYDMIGQAGFSSIDFRSLTGETALHVALAARRTPWVTLLLSKNANPDLAREDGETPLLIATRLLDTGSVEALLRYKAQPNRSNRLGETPLMVAVQLRNKRLVEMLLEAGANPDLADNAAGLTARDYAARETRMPELLALIEANDEKAEDEPKEELKFGPILR